MVSRGPQLVLSSSFSISNLPDAVVPPPPVVPSLPPSSPLPPLSPLSLLPVVPPFSEGDTVVCYESLSPESVSVSSQDVNVNITQSESARTKNNAINLFIRYSLILYYTVIITQEWRRVNKKLFIGVPYVAWANLSRKLMFESLLRASVLTKFFYWCYNI